LNARRADGGDEEENKRNDEPEFIPARSMVGLHYEIFLFLKNLFLRGGPVAVSKSASHRVVE
jgi:hypothetical protein